ncbi:rod-determining factor RdfA [Natrinema gelatinilyticum]|uniref:rod-determining factor RdfA n=1 Tax=Natrinema gelatinilyticum TaxID=2961571 RepID=UPI0020C3977B|nr:rod-determining factor RdfA [Natrinema gelatinilyticum]
MSSEGEGENDFESDETVKQKPDSKVAQLIESYDLGASFGDTLEELWTADGEKRESLRTLADRFNKRLFEAAVSDAGMATLDGEISNMYRLLTDEDVSSGNRIETRRRLEQNGVNITQLEQDFVTYQAIRSYLKEHRGAQYDNDTTHTRVDGVIDTIQRLKSRTISVAEKSLLQLRDTNQLALGEFQLFIDINVYCEECETQYGFVELLQQGGCECQLADNE